MFYSGQTLCLRFHSHLSFSVPSHSQICSSYLKKIAWSKVVFLISSPRFRL